MPFLYVETARERLCKGSRLMLGGLCNGTLVPSALKAVREKTHHQTVKIIFPEQSTDAVIYVTVVVVFYAAIILILVGTNIHRFRRNRAGALGNGEPNEPPKHQVVVRMDHRERTYQTSAPPEDIKAEVENQETDGALV
ncbi:uncharacterized protein [Parasteatoda tepidariorum]|uniref:uncharacterized protein isoform X1 n=1 Tax=Parasteatoda tepidariorum TaxID=114398 RepID=UPI00077FBA1E|nr:uncharacterized protein LOC107438419 isoform X1 [Parasteatoda tepidariorum]